MRYLSTRDAGPAPATHTFEEVLLAGLADDGGLFVPETLPKLSAAQLAGLAGRPYAELAAEIVALFAGETFAGEELSRLTGAAYGTFRHAAVAPLVQLDERLWLLELFHGPTLAFKDLALQLVGRLFDAALARRGEQVTIIGATSGDTGSAALAACRDRAALDIFMLYPHGRISEVQRRQMTTVDAANAHALAIEGTFDDCQDIVKALFADRGLRQELNLSAVNSINFARVAAQIVYYISAGLALGAASGRAVSFSVPTGNFGNVYAGHLARAMGLPIERLVIGTNANDILARYVATGEMTIGPVAASLSPSMDIQVASNFERLLFDLKGRNGAAVAEAVQAFRRDRALPKDTVKVMDSDVSQNASADASVSEANGTPFVEQVRITIRPVRLKLLFKMERYESTARYRIGPDGKPILMEQTSDMTGSGMGQEGSGHTVATYSDYRVVGNQR